MSDNVVNQSDIDRLRATVEALQQVYDRTRTDLAQREQEMGCNCDSELMRTSDGRYILLDPLTALVNAQAVLVQAEAPKLAVEEALVIQEGDTLLLRMAEYLSSAELDRYADVFVAPLKDRLGLKDVVLLGGGIDGWAVKR